MNIGLRIILKKMFAQKNKKINNKRDYLSIIKLFVASHKENTSVITHVWHNKNWGFMRTYIPCYILK